jgi:hypothetical protein
VTDNEWVLYTLFGLTVLCVLSGHKNPEFPLMCGVLVIMWIAYAEFSASWLPYN